MEELRKSIKEPSKRLIRDDNFTTLETEKGNADEGLEEDAFMTQDYQLPEDGTPLRRSIENVSAPEREAWELAQKSKAVALE